MEKKYLTELFDSKFDFSGELHYYAIPGRIEICGNHTDHNNGFVLAAAAALKTCAAAIKNDHNIINIYSLNLDLYCSVDLNGSQEARKEEKGKTSALIRGIAARFRSHDFNTGGFNCVINSEIGVGSGLSSSASVEVLFGSILNDLYNNNKIDPVQIALTGQYAENVYYGKPCGLMDQLAIASGGILLIDFLDPSSPVIQKIHFDIYDAGYSIVIVNTGGSHAGLGHEYKSIPDEMKSVAAYFNKPSCRSITKDDIVKNIKELRKRTGDRAILRALHYLSENERVVQAADALKNNDINLFFKIVNDSGSSSSKYLQNIYAPGKVEEQGLNIALNLTETFIKENKNRGALRIHGGGFAGTILTFIETSQASNYINLMNGIFGNNSAVEVKISS